jgi:hypothetical protein
MRRFKEPDWNNRACPMNLPDPLVIERVLISDKSRDTFKYLGQNYVVKFVIHLSATFANSRAEVCVVKPASKVKYFKKVV